MDWTATNICLHMSHQFYSGTEPEIVAAVAAGICRRTAEAGVLCADCGRLVTACGHSAFCVTNLPATAIHYAALLGVDIVVP